MKKFYITFLTFLFAIMVINFNEALGNTYKKTISIDLDGVLDNYTKYDANYIPEIKKVQESLYKNCIKMVIILYFYK